MAKVQLSVEVEKELHEVAQLVADVVKALKAKKPVLQIVSEEFAALEQAVAGMSEIPAEMAEDRAAALKAVMLPMCDMVDALLPAKAAPAPAAAPQA